MNNLLILLLLPVLSAVLLAVVKDVVRAKWLALALALLELGLTIPFLAAFVPDASVQFEQRHLWLGPLGIVFHIGLDGISLPLVLLTNALIPLIVLASFKKGLGGSFFALMAFMQSGLLLVFSALDAFSFYVGWEVALIPIYFICGLWGEGDRIGVNLKFFVYTFLGSLLMLVALIYLYQQSDSPSLDWTALMALDLSAPAQRWVFWAFFIAFAVKIPILPFHTWQPDTYAGAPAAGTMLLAGIMLKMGLYGLLRWLLPLVPLGVEAYGTLALCLCIVGVVYASIIAFKQQDAKRLLAFSSIAHVGLISAGIFAGSVLGWQGALLQMLNHGLSVLGLFLVIDVLQDRTGSRLLSDWGGMARKMPRLATLFLIILMGAIGLPLTNGFIGEFLLLRSVFDIGVWFAVFAGLTLILGAVYMLRFYQKAMLGPLPERFEGVWDVDGAELLVLVLIAFFTVFLGLFPGMILEISEVSVTHLLSQINF